MRSHLGVVLHVNQSNGNLYEWVAGDHNMSCHFEVYKNGSIEQYLDTDVSSWCQMAGNADYLSIETEGYDNEPLTPAQVTAIAGLVKWMHDTHGIALQLAEHPGEAGFGWHGMGGEAWGGHPACPGTLRRNQRELILQLAAGAPATRRRSRMFVYYVSNPPKSMKGNVFSFNGAAVRQIFHGADVDATLAGIGQAKLEPISFEQHSAWLKGSK